MTKANHQSQSHNGHGTTFYSPQILFTLYTVAFWCPLVGPLSKSTPAFSSQVFLVVSIWNNQLLPDLFTLAPNGDYRSLICSLSIPFQCIHCLFVVYVLSGIFKAIPGLLQEGDTWWGTRCQSVPWLVMLTLITGHGEVARHSCKIN